MPIKQVDKIERGTCCYHSERMPRHLPTSSRADQLRSSFEPPFVVHIHVTRYSTPERLHRSSNQQATACTAGMMKVYRVKPVTAQYPSHGSVRSPYI
jgi:hypothetical protein